MMFPFYMLIVMGVRGRQPRIYFICANVIVTYRPTMSTYACQNDDGQTGKTKLIFWLSNFIIERRKREIGGPGPGPGRRQNFFPSLTPAFPIVVRVCTRTTFWKEERIIIYNDNFFFFFPLFSEVRYLSPTNHSHLNLNLHTARSIVRKIIQLKVRKTITLLKNVALLLV